MTSTSLITTKPSSPTSAASSLPTQKRRKKFTRSNTGCLSCRKRKKKCDGAKPQCSACTRLGKHCEYPFANLQWQFYTANEGAAPLALHSHSHSHSHSHAHSHSNSHSNSRGRSDGQRKEPVFKMHYGDSKPARTARTNRPTRSSDSSVRNCRKPARPEFRPEFRTDFRPEYRPDFRPEFPELSSVNPVTAFLTFPFVEAAPHTSLLSPASEQWKQPWNFHFTGNFGEPDDYGSSTSSSDDLGLIFPGYGELQQFIDSQPSLESLHESQKQGVPSSVPSTPPPLSPPAFAPPSALPLSQNDTAKLLHAFQHTVAPRISSLATSDNSFVATFLPLAYTYPPVLRALLGWTATWLHVLRLDSELPVDLPASAVHELLDGVEAEAEALCLTTGKGPKHAELLLALSGILVAQDVLLTGNGMWRNFLVMTKRAVESVGVEQMCGSRQTRWLLQSFLYHELTGTHTAVQGVWLSSEQLKAVLLADTEPEAYMGLCRPLFVHLAEIFALSARRYRGGLGADLAKIWVEAALLEAAVAQCCPLPIPAGVSETDESVAAHLRMFSVLQKVLILLLRQLVYRQSSRSVETELLVTKARQELETLAGPGVDPLLLFALFIVGIDCINPGDRAWLLKSLKGLYGRMQLGNIKTAGKLLKEIWAANPTGNCFVFWPDVAESSSYDVSLA